MSEDFSLLFRFLERCGPEATGRMVLEPPKEAAQRIERLAKGACNERERREVCELLRANPVWLRWLAGQVKLARVQGGFAS